MHPLATHSSIRLRELRNEDFIGAHEADMPGHNQWIIKLCRRARFRPRFVENAESLSQSLSIVVSEGAIALVSEHVKKMPFPPGEFLNVTCGVKAWSGGFLVFTLLSNDTTSREYETGFKLVKESFEEKTPAKTM